ncbi:MAG: hypothetical protein FWD09_03340 [Lentimicrobiaceae bacterium]|nr:hypothetical protein [Lentimicrobiaceae bacterium]
MKKIIYPLFLSFLLLSACQDYEGLVNAEDQLIAVSLVDLTFDFKDVVTFSVTDTITDLFVDARGRVTEKKSAATFQKEVIIKQMTDRGFTYVPLDSISDTYYPDLFFDITYVENQYVQVLGFGWWYSYDPYWFWWDTWSPYYPVSYTYVTSYTAKSLIMDCFSFTETFRNYTVNSRFMGLVRGITKFPENEIKRYMEQTFDQTPELSRN